MLFKSSVNTEQVKNRVSEIISTDRRKEILTVITNHPGGFIVVEIYEILKRKNVDIKYTSVLNVIKALYYAGFLTETPETNKDRKNRRPKLFYSVAPRININHQVLDAGSV